MKRIIRTFAAALLISSALALTPAHAQGSAIDPNGVWAWFVSLFSDQGSQLDPDGVTRKGLGSDPNG